MTYLFSGTSEEMMAAFFHHLENAREGGPNADREFRQALIGIVGFHDRLAQVGQLNPETLQQFGDGLCEALLAFRDDIAAYTQRAIILAEGANDGEWYELCMRRSVIQFLIDDCSGTPLSPLLDLTEVADLDEELRRVGNEQGPVPEQLIPKGLPDNNWWWHYPSGIEEG